MQVTSRHRLVTRSDFDGLVCAVLLRDLDLIDDITFVHPKDMQDGVVPISDRDITTNLPYVDGAHLVFDHHASETLRNEPRDNHVIDPAAPSAARVVYDFYGGRDAFPSVSEEMMAAVDKADSAQFELAEVLDPQGWVLLNFLMDARTGLGRFRNFRISNYELMMELIDACRNHGIDEILALPDVAERVELYREQEPLFRDQLARCTTVDGNLAVVDLRGEGTIHAGNRFLVYALHPEVNISMHVMWGRQKQNVVFAVGKSIFNRTSRTDIGRVLLAYGGGGHANAGTCQVGHADADRTQRKLVAHVTADG
ncbi:MAG: Exopolyphosphatase-related protein [Acidimicrobiales bacterium]|nr:Exopolyphosphatase-related protein [Acidimicrobiales bacterium]